MTMEIEAAFEEEIARVGGIEILRKELEDFGNRSRMLLNQKSELTAKHPRKWVALLEGEIFVFATSREKLRAAIRDEGKSARTAVIDYLDPAPAVVVL